MKVPESVLVIGTGNYVGDSLVKSLVTAGSFVYCIQSKGEGCRTEDDLVKIIKTYKLEKIYLVESMNDHAEQFTAAEVERVSQISGIPLVSILTTSIIP